jgi:hypothetical protein
MLRYLAGAAIAATGLAGQKSVPILSAMVASDRDAGKRGGQHGK